VRYNPAEAEYRHALTGKQCSDQFCPPGTQCRRGDVQSYCCADGICRGRVK
jgi:hypothetical protein